MAIVSLLLSADVTGDVRRYAGTTADGTGIIAFRDNRPYGFIALKPEPYLTDRPLTPWVGAAYVVPSQRGTGIGFYLFAQIERIAAQLSVPVIYCATHTAQGILHQQHWQKLAHPQQQSDGLYYKNL